jgi:hypothetical protein
MSHKLKRCDEVAFQHQFEEAVQLAMRHVGLNYSEALELVFLPVKEQGGLSVAEFVRRGNLPQAKRALSSLLDERRKVIFSSSLVSPQKMDKNSRKV